MTRRISFLLAFSHLFGAFV